MYRPEFADRAALCCQVGLTDYEIATVFGVGTSTITLWRHQHREFAEALRTGKVIADERVERALYHKALGYTFDEEEIHIIKGKVVRVQVTKHMPPSDSAMIFWLKNRRKNDWRDVHKLEHGAVGAFDHMTIEQLKASIAEDIKTLDLIPLPEPEPVGVANRGTNGLGKKEDG